MFLEDRYKPIIFTVELTSRPINDTEEVFDGSYLNVVWFGGDFKTHTIEKIPINLKVFSYNLSIF
jgi:hypothetical protein